MVGISILGVSILLSTAWSLNTNVDDANKFIEDVYKRADEITHAAVVARWDVDLQPHPNTDSLIKLSTAVEEQSIFEKYIHDKVVEFDWKSFDQPLKRKFSAISDFKDDLLSDGLKQRLKTLESRLDDLDLTASVKPFGSQDVQDITTFSDELSSEDSNNSAEELAYYWKELMDRVQKPKKKVFTEWIQVKTKTAKLNGHDNILDYWKSQDAPLQFRSFMLPLFEEVKPFFKELYSYVRYKLRNIYPDTIPPNGAIPAGLPMFDWKWRPAPNTLREQLGPMETRPEPDITGNLAAQNLEGKAMVEKVDEFFTSLGFDKLSEDFYTKSFFTKEEDRVCTWKNYDFVDGKDFRLNVCPAARTKHFYHTASKVFDILWEIAYKDQPHFFRKKPVYAYSVKRIIIGSFDNPTYLKKQNLLEDSYNVDESVKINSLFNHAMGSEIFDLPLAVAFTEWQLDQIGSRDHPLNDNCKFWNLRTKYQGVEPPVARSNSDFDAALYGEKLTFPKFLNEFLSTFAMFDVLSALCKAGGHTPEDGLMFCDISNNKEAGTKLKEAMKLGVSVPWPEVMEKITGSQEFTASGFLEYFKPLHDWLKTYNDGHNVDREWPETQTKCQD